MNVSRIGLEGFQRAERQMESNAARIARAPQDPENVRPENSEMAAALVGLMASQRMAEANLKMIQAGVETEKKLLDVLL